MLPSPVGDPVDCSSGWIGVWQGDSLRVESVSSDGEGGGVGGRGGRGGGLGCLGSLTVMTPHLGLCLRCCSVVAGALVAAGGGALPKAVELMRVSEPPLNSSGDASQVGVWLSRVLRFAPRVVLARSWASAAVRMSDGWSDCGFTWGLMHRSPWRHAGAGPCDPSTPRTCAACQAQILPACVAGGAGCLGGGVCEPAGGGAAAARAQLPPGLLRFCRARLWHSVPRGGAARLDREAGARLPRLTRSG